MEPQTSDTPEPSEPIKDHGKRPVWRYVLLYIVVAIVLYGLAYLIFFHQSRAGSH